jgi:hypothetical protein
MMIEQKDSPIRTRISVTETHESNIKMNNIIFKHPVAFEILYIND